MTAVVYPLAEELVAFIKEREAIRTKKEMGCPRPWTSDPILDTYRFCNVHREDDRVTRELRAIIHPTPLDAWFAWVVARLFNKTSTLKQIRMYISPFSPEKMRRTLKQIRLEDTIFNPAYIVSTNGVSMDKVDYLIERVLTPMWRDRRRLRPDWRDTLETYHLRLMGYDGMGSFLAAQVVADLKYIEPLKSAADWQTFAASGPGSRRGLNRVMGAAPEAAWRRGAWEDALIGLAECVKAPLAEAGIALHNQDLQNCLCELDKYRRCVEGGRAKQIYKEK